MCLKSRMAERRGPHKDCPLVKAPHACVYVHFFKAHAPTKYTPPPPPNPPPRTHTQEIMETGQGPAERTLLKIMLKREKPRAQACVQRHTICTVWTTESAPGRTLATQLHHTALTPRFPSTQCDEVLHTDTHTPPPKAPSGKYGAQKVCTHTHTHLQHQTHISHKGGVGGEEGE